MLLGDITHTVIHWVDVGATCDMLIWTVMLRAPESRHSLCVWEWDKDFFEHLTNGTLICEQMKTDYFEQILRQC